MSKSNLGGGVIVRVADGGGGENLSLEVYKEIHFI